MTDGKIRTIRRWNDLCIGENPIRARRRSNDPHKKALLVLAIPFTPRCAEAPSKRQGIWGRGLMETITNRNASKPSPPPQKPLQTELSKTPAREAIFGNSF
jgi:hypothetical protein